MHEAKRQNGLEQKVEATARDAFVDKRSVWKRLAGGTLRPLTQCRVDRALAAHGLSPGHDSTPPPSAVGGE